MLSNDIDICYKLKVNTMNNITMIMILINCTFWFLIATVPPKICLHFLGKSPPSPNSFLFKVYCGEIRFYRLIGIRWWKKFLPVMPGGELDRKHIKRKISLDYLRQMTEATCTTELIHFVCGLAGFQSILFALILPDPSQFIFLFIVIASLNFIAQLPFIAAQRYNRVRFIRIQKIMVKRDQSLSLTHRIDKA